MPIMSSSYPPMMPYVIVEFTGPDSSLATPLMPSTTTMSSSFPRLPDEIFNPSTQYYSLFLSSAAQEEDASPPLTNRPALVSLRLQADNTTTEQHLDLHNLLAFSAAQEAINTMLLSNSRTMETDSEYCKFLRRLLSSFVHKAAAVVAARKRESADAASSLLRISLRIDVLRKPPAAEEEEEMAAKTSSSSSTAADQSKRELLPVTCPVCLTDFTFSDGEQIISTACFHVFHKECIGEWLHRPGGNHCPLCRASMS